MSVCAPSLPHPALNSSLTRAKEEFYPGPSDERHQTILLSYQRTSPVSSHFVCCPFRVFSITWLTASDASPPLSDCSLPLYPNRLRETRLSMAAPELL